MENNQKVSLGCGTLIIIAIIVMIFSNKPKINIEVISKLDRLQLEMNDMQTQVRSLQDSLEVMKQLIIKKK